MASRLPIAKSRVHEVTIVVTFNLPVTAKQARDALWNALEGFNLWGNGDAAEPWSTGRIKVRRSPPRKRRG